MNTDMLISDFYAAAAGRIGWEKPLADMSASLQLWGVQVIGLNKRTGGLIFSAEGGPAPPEATLDYIRVFHASNPRMEPVLATPIGEWMHCHEHFDEAYVAASPFYQDFLIPYGGRYLSATKLIENDDVLVLLGVLRGVNSQPIGAGEMPLLLNVKHHLTEAFKNFNALRSNFAELSIARDLLSQFDYPMLLLDEARGILLKNDSAFELLKSETVIAERSGVLICKDKRSDAALTDAVHGTHALVSSIKEIDGKRVVSLKKVDGSPCLAFVSPLHPAQTQGVFGTMPRALLVLHDPGQSPPALDPFIVAECFGMTPAEARIAVCIANGISVKEIAQRTGVALPTVRTHLQRVLRKAGVDRQTDLMRVLLTLPSRE